MSAIVRESRPVGPSRVQLRRALVAAGLWDTFKSSLAAADDVTREEWELSNVIERAHPLVAAFAAGVEAQTGQAVDLDAIFADAWRR